MRNSVFHHLSFILFLSVFFVTSCAVKRVELPTYVGVDPRFELARRDAVTSIHSTFSIEFERDGGVVKGDAALQVTPDSLDLRVYSLGFLVAEVISNDTMVKSDPPLDRNRLAMLIDGIRNSFFWWSIRNYDIREEEKAYRVWNSWRRLLINKKTLLPEKQVIELEDGRELDVIYDEPDNIGGIWFPRTMRIALSRYSVNLRIKTLSVTLR